MPLPSLQRRHWLLPAIAAVHLLALSGVNWVLDTHPQPEKKNIVFTLITGLHELEAMQPDRKPDQITPPEPRILNTFVPESISPPSDLPEAPSFDEAPPSTAITVRTASASPPAPAAPVSGSEDKARDDFISLLASHLARHKQYPVEARRRHITGVVTVRFRIHADGRLDECSIVDSSGNRLLDAAALAMLRRAQPLPRIPPELAMDSLSINLPVEFSLAYG